MADPYHIQVTHPLFSDQFPLPQQTLRVSATFRRLVACVEPFESALIQITDWGLCQPDEMAVVTCVRQACGEHRNLIETPGHLFAAPERDLLIGWLTLITAYGWSAYLYLDHGFTFLSWEGELLDVWNFDFTAIKTIREIMQNMGLSSTLL